MYERRPLNSDASELTEEEEVDRTNILSTANSYKYLNKRRKCKKSSSHVANSRYSDYQAASSGLTAYGSEAIDPPDSGMTDRDPNQDLGPNTFSNMKQHNSFGSIIILSVHIYFRLIRI